MAHVGKFGKLAGSLSKSPLGIIALFIVLIYGVAGLVLGFSAETLDPSERSRLIWFLVLFPVIVLATFAWLVSRHHRKLYGPSDFKDESVFLQTIGVEDIQKSI